MPNATNEVIPTKLKIKKVTMVGMGFLIDQAERWKDIKRSQEPMLRTINLLCRISSKVGITSH